MEKLVLFFIFLFVIFLIFRSRKIYQEVTYNLENDRYDRALETSAKARNWFLIVCCLEKIEEVFLDLDEKDFERVTSVMQNIGCQKEVRRFSEIRKREGK